MTPRRFALALAAIAGGALAIRLIYTVGFVGGYRGFGGDYVFFHDIANLIADGRGYISPFTLGIEGEVRATAEHPPLWPLLLAAMSKLGGTTLLAHRLVGCLAGAATVVALGLLGRRVAGEKAGLLAAGLGAVYPVLIAADGSLMSEPLYGLWVALTLLAALRLFDHPTSWRAGAVGAAIGLATLTRSEAILLVPLVLLPVALKSGPGRLARAAVGCLALLVVLAPWTVRNWTTFDRPVLVSTNDGTVLTGANCPKTYSGPSLGFWLVECRSQVVDENEAVQSAVWRGEGIDYALDHPGRLAVVIPVRLARTFDLYHPLEQVQFAEGRPSWAAKAGIVSFFALLPLAIYGAVRLWPSRARLAVLLAPLAMVLFTTVTAYGYARFRHAAEVSLVVLAAVGVNALRERRAAPPTASS